MPATASGNPSTSSGSSPEHSCCSGADGTRSETVTAWPIGSARAISMWNRSVDSAPDVLSNPQGAEQGADQRREPATAAAYQQRQGQRPHAQQQVAVVQQDRGHLRQAGAPRELEVLRLVAEGLSNAEIAPASTSARRP
jgi:hypothetical protein